MEYHYETTRGAIPRVFFAATLGPLVLKVSGRFYELSVKTRKDY
jgi:hypothetical protein